MPKLTIDEIRHRFETSKAFNVMFDAFEQALEQRLEDMEMYRPLFWNKFLSSDEICLFGEKLATEFPHLAFDVYLWLGSVFAVNYSMYDNYDLAVSYFTKAAHVKPEDPSPYIEAAQCYESDLNIPPVTTLITFLKSGCKHVANPHPLYEKLASFYEITGNDEMLKYYRLKLDPPAPGASISPDIAPA